MLKIILGNWSAPISIDSCGISSWRILTCITIDLPSFWLRRSDSLVVGCRCVWRGGCVACQLSSVSFNIPSWWNFISLNSRRVIAGNGLSHYGCGRGTDFSSVRNGGLRLFSWRLDVSFLFVHDNSIFFNSLVPFQIDIIVIDGRYGPSGDIRAGTFVITGIISPSLDSVSIISVVGSCSVSRGWKWISEAKLLVWCRYLSNRVNFPIFLFDFLRQRCFFFSIYPGRRLVVIVMDNLSLPIFTASIGRYSLTTLNILSFGSVGPWCKLFHYYLLSLFFHWLRHTFFIYCCISSSFVLRI